jgi:hypothetical protein
MWHFLLNFFFSFCEAKWERDRRLEGEEESEFKRLPVPKGEGEGEGAPRFFFIPPAATLIATSSPSFLNRSPSTPTTHTFSLKEIR